MTAAYRLYNSAILGSPKERTFVFAGTHNVLPTITSTKNISAVIIKLSCTTEVNALTSNVKYWMF